MRIVSIILAAAVVGTLVGASVGYIEVQPGGNALAASGPIAHPASAPVGESAPRVQVDEPNFQFGVMQRGTSKSHKFIFHNVGHGPLTLHVGSTSCKCTVGDVADKPLQPGESVPVTLEWTARVGVGEFRQSASIITNDPSQSKVDLSVEGTVTEASNVSPPDFVFDKVAAGKSKSAEVYVMSLLQDSVEVGEPVLSFKDTQKFFDVKIEKVDRESLPKPEAKDGVRITITAKPGLPLGRFDQWLKLPTNITDAEKLEIPIIGQVVGDISVHGRLWNSQQGVLRIGPVKSSEGFSTTLNLVVRGNGADNVTMSVASTDPPELVAKLGEPKKLKPTLVHVPLTIEIPKGTPPIARLDTEQSEPAHVTLKTSHPDAPEMVLGVRFAVER